MVQRLGHAQCEHANPRLSVVCSFVQEPENVLYVRHAEDWRAQSREFSDLDRIDEALPRETDNLSTRKRRFSPSGTSAETLECWDTPLQ